MEIEASKSCQVATLEHKLADLRSENAKLLEEVSSVRADARNKDLEKHKFEYQLETEVKSLNLIIDNLKQDQRDNIANKQRLETKETEITILKQEIENLRDRAYKIEASEKEFLENEKNSLRLQIMDLQAKKDLFMDSKAEKEKQNTDLAAQLNEMQIAVNDKDREVLKLRARVAELEQYCDELLEKLNQWNEMDSKAQLLVNKLEETPVDMTMELEKPKIVVEDLNKSARKAPTSSNKKAKGMKTRPIGERPAFRLA